MIKYFIYGSLLLVITLVFQAMDSEKPDTDASKKTITAQQVIQRIKSNVNCKWKDETVDTFKSGNPKDEVKGIAICFMATMDVLKQAQAKGCNLIITHEPTYYNHLDETEHLKKNSVFLEKMKFIKDNNLIIWRFHDHIHKHRPDGIVEGMVEKLSWEENQLAGSKPIFNMKEQKLEDFVKLLKGKLNTTNIRYIGKPDMVFTKVGLKVGAAGAKSQMSMLESPDVEVLVAGEAREWETVEYARDAMYMGKNKALVLLGHALSEEAGMQWCTKWLKGFVDEVEVVFIPTGEPFH